MTGTAKRKRNSKGHSVAQEPNEAELRLADSLFGTGSLSKAKKAKQRVTDAIEQDDENDVLNARAAPQSTTEQYLDDDQLFVMDTAGNESVENGSDSSGSLELSDSEDEEGERSSEQESNDYQVAHNDEAGPSVVNGNAKKTARRQPVWTDPSSATLTVALAGPEARAVDGSRRGTSRLRKLREAPDEVSISGTEYEMRLRRMFEKLHPRPRWASLELRKGKEGVKSIGDLLNSDVGLVSRVTGDSRSKRAAIAAQQLQVQRLRNANQAQGQADLPSIETLSFHPGSRANIMMTTSKDRRLRLFNIDGKDNPLLQTVHISDMDMCNARFHPLGSSILLSGKRPYIYVHDVYTTKTIKSSPWRGFGDDSLQARDLSMARFSSAIDGGRHLAIGVRRGAVHLLDWGNVGGSSAGSLIGTLRMNAPLAGLTWDPVREHGLVSLSTQGTIHTWDARNMSCEVQRTDVGLFGPNGIEAHPTGQLFAVGSQDGIVNMYDREAVLGEGVVSRPLEPRKAIRNIVTTTTSVEYNPTGELLAIASSKKKDAMKMVHVPTLSVFENWPTSSTPLGSVSAVGFSTGSEYLAIGNTRGKALLYSLNHYT